ncbi:FG-GAP repeat domain-containing protein [Engelhardtia mirabilis]|uniref:FG-GAP repeat protein n=1 Tax=Engelhardtia mirabilis TaxID=2528011 RepID=A0A518BRD2_9BACT|nr:FG-GAP repeat protein [Planctomycetes bacterium Pla133]QDV03836.1 FG-GAP repeat protein [Planctomycetes bacterium Pla86]
MRPSPCSLACCLLSLVAHGQGEATSSSPNDDAKPGLILAISVFAAGSAPQPATMLLLRPSAEPDGPWTSEEIVTEPSSLTVQPGTAPGGETVFRVAQAGEPIGAVVRLEPSDGVWAPVAADDIAVDSVQWQVRGDKEFTKNYEMAGGNVFHKALWWEPLYGEPGILTISANMPFLQIWRSEDGTWTPELLWTANVGGREQRFRDIEIGDLDGDGVDELAIVTHDRGGVYVLEQTPSGLEALRLHETRERIFVHEVELGDVDGDGVPELFTTPSEPNRLDGEQPAGWIDMYRYVPERGQYVRSVIAHLPTSRAREILAFDYDQDGAVELYAAVESETSFGASAARSEPVEVQSFVWDAAASAMVAGPSVAIEGSMCRFLCGGDTDGDGSNELIASTNNGGIYRLTLDGGQWIDERIVPPFATGGFEHATALLDFDGDGADDLFVANDNKDQVMRVQYDPESGRYRRIRVQDLSGVNYMAWSVVELPAGR